MVADLARAAEDSVLIALVQLVAHLPVPAPPRRRGRPPVYSDRLFLKALVVMIVRRLAQVHTRLAVLEEPTPERRRLRALLTEGGRVPARRTWERRLRAVPDRLPAQIGGLGRALVGALAPWRHAGRAVAIDRTVPAARGGVWHRTDRERGVVPHTAIDTEAAWTKRGWHGWGYGWKLHLVSTAAAGWIPLAADLTPAHTADSAVAPALLDELPPAARFVLGDQHYGAPTVRAGCARAGRVLVTPRRGPYPHTAPGAAVRRAFHALRHHATENLNEQFKGIFGCHGQVPTRGRRATRRFALGAVLVYQLALLYRSPRGGARRQGLKPLLCAA
jgi:hypothetical protein